MIENRFLYWMDRLYGYIILIGSNLQSVFLLYMRLTWGHQFFLAGLDKINHIQETIDFFTGLNIAYPVFHAYEIAWLEAIGGILLIVGLASRLISIPLIFAMVAALTTAHSDYLLHFRFLKEPLVLVIQQPYPFLITTLLVLIFGPGRVSLDALIKRWVHQQSHY